MGTSFTCRRATLLVRPLWMATISLPEKRMNSGINWSAEKDNDAGDLPAVENVNHKQTPAQLLFNVREAATLPNLETFLANNGTIDLVAYAAKPADAAPAANQVYISEVMWGSDASQNSCPITANGSRSLTERLVLSRLLRMDGHCGSIKRTRHRLTPMRKRMARWVLCRTGSARLIPRRKSVGRLRV